MLGQLDQKSPGCLLAAPLSHQDIQHVTMLIHGTPEIENLTVDLDHNLIKAPLVTRLWSVATDGVGRKRAELAFPIPHRLVAGFNPAIAKQFLDIAKAQTEAIIQPRSMADDLSWKAVTFERIRARFQHPSVLLKSPIQAENSPN